jgi:hypothetical protein
MDVLVSALSQDEMLLADQDISIYRFLLKDKRYILVKMVELNGIEPMTSCLQGRRSPN